MSIEMSEELKSDLQPQPEPAEIIQPDDGARLKQLESDKATRMEELSRTIDDLAAIVDVKIHAASDTPASVEELIAAALAETGNSKLNTLAQSVEQFRAYALNEVINPLRANGGDVPTIAEVFAKWGGA